MSTFERLSKAYTEYEKEKETSTSPSQQPEKREQICGLVKNQLQKIRSQIESEQNKVENGSPMYYKLQGDITLVNNKLDAIEPKHYEINYLNFERELKDVCQHFSNRLEEEKSELAKVKKEQNLAMSELNILNKTRNQLVKTTHCGRSAFQHDLNSDLQTLNSEITRIEPELGLKNIDRQELIKKLQNPETKNETEKKVAEEKIKLNPKFELLNKLKSEYWKKSSRIGHFVIT